MTTANYNITATFIPLLALFTLTSCHHKELCEEHPCGISLRVEFQWDAAPDAAPEGMTVWFYPDDRTKPVRRFDFTGRDGGEATLPTGSYRAIACNNDTEATHLGATDRYDAHYAYTGECDILYPLSGHLASYISREGDERVITEPDMLWGCGSDIINVTPYTGTIILRPEERVCRWTYEVRNIKGMELISQTSASLSGLSPSVITATGTASAIERVTLSMEAHLLSSNALGGEFLTFGCPEPEENRLLLYVITTDGRKLIIGRDLPSHDVTGQITHAPDRRKVHIVIDGLDIPVPDSPGYPPSLGPSIDDWTDTNIDINI